MAGCLFKIDATSARQPASRTRGRGSASRFYLSLEDDLMRIFSASVSKPLQRLGMEEGVPIESTDHAPSKGAESGHGQNRPATRTEYDDAMNKQPVAHGLLGNRKDRPEKPILDIVRDILAGCSTSTAVKMFTGRLTSRA